MDAEIEKMKKVINGLDRLEQDSFMSTLTAGCVLAAKPPMPELIECDQQQKSEVTAQTEALKALLEDREFSLKVLRLLWDMVLCAIKLAPPSVTFALTREPQFAPYAEAFENKAFIGKLP